MLDERFWLKNYDKHVKPNLNFTNKGLNDLFIKGLTSYPDKYGCHFMKNHMKFSEIYDLALKLASFLQKNNLKKGDVVGICLPNTPQYVITHIATIISGGVSLGLSFLLSSDEMIFQLNDSKAKFLIIMDSIGDENLNGRLNEIPYLKVILYTNVGDMAGLPKFLVSFAKLMKKLPSGKITPVEGKTIQKFMDVIKNSEPNYKMIDINPREDLAQLYYTGGTTGKPKGVELTHLNVISNMLMIQNWIDFKEAEDTFLYAFPIFHTAGVLSLNFGIVSSNPQILIANPRDTKHILKEIIALKPSMVMGVPSIYMMMVNDPYFSKVHKEVFKRLKVLVSGAAPFPAQSILEFEKKIGVKNKVLEVYGMTECSPLIAANPFIGKKKVGTVGLPIQDTTVKIIEIGSGEEVDIGNIGEVLVKGPQVMKGYRNNPLETEKVIDHDGWLHTGDVGFMDKDGYITLVDRLKDMINVSGFKVFSVYIEEILVKHPYIDQAAIIGVNNEKRPGSEIVKAIIKLNSDIKFSEDIKREIIEYSSNKLSKYEIPKIWEFRNELPLTPVGKISKVALRKELEK